MTTQKINIKITTSYTPLRTASVTSSGDCWLGFKREVSPGIHVNAHWSHDPDVAAGGYGEYFITDIIVLTSDALPDFKAIEKAIADWDYETRGFEFDFNSNHIEIKRFVDPDRGRSKSTVQWENT